MSSGSNRSLKENVEEYIDLQKERLLLNAADKASNVLSEMAVRISYMVCGLFAMVFLSLSLALLLNHLLLSPFLGFLIIALLYAAGSFFLFKKGKSWMGSYIACELLNIFYNNDDDK